MKERHRQPPRDEPEIDLTDFVRFPSNQGKCPCCGLAMYKGDDLTIGAVRSASGQEYDTVRHKDCKAIGAKLPPKKNQPDVESIDWAAAREYVKSRAQKKLVTLPQEKKQPDVRSIDVVAAQELVKRVDQKELVTLGGVMQLARATLLPFPYTSSLMRYNIKELEEAEKIFKKNYDKAIGFQKEEERFSPVYDIMIGVTAVLTFFSSTWHMSIPILAALYAHKAFKLYNANRIKVETIKEGYIKLGVKDQVDSIDGVCTLHDTVKEVKIPAEPRQIYIPSEEIEFEFAPFHLKKRGTVDRISFDRSLYRVKHDKYERHPLLCELVDEAERAVHLYNPQFPEVPANPAKDYSETLRSFALRHKLRWVSIASQLIGEHQLAFFMNPEGLYKCRLDKNYLVRGELGYDEVVVLEHPYVSKKDCISVERLPDDIVKKLYGRSKEELFALLKGMGQALPSIDIPRKGTIQPMITNSNLSLEYIDGLGYSRGVRKRKE